jgi:hypothetical protein
MATFNVRTTLTAVEIAKLDELKALASANTHKQFHEQDMCRYASVYAGSVVQYSLRCVFPAQISSCSPVGCEKGRQDD